MAANILIDNASVVMINWSECSAAENQISLKTSFQSYGLYKQTTEDPKDDSPQSSRAGDKETRRLRNCKINQITEHTAFKRRIREHKLQSNEALILLNTDFPMTIQEK